VIIPQYANSCGNTWVIWEDFCLELAIDPLLHDVTDPTHYLMVFAIRYRDGRLAKHGQPVHSCTVEDALCSIGQTMARMGAKDQCLIAPKKVEYHLSQQLKGYANVDPEPTRVKPVPISFVHHISHVARQANIVFDLAVADMVTIGFYYLCRPGEYALSSDAT